MEHKEALTNEQYTKRFTNQFELVNYAIKLAENMIKSGRGPYIKTDDQNTALIILDEIADGADTLEDIIPVPVKPIVAQPSFEMIIEEEEDEEEEDEEEPTAKKGAKNVAKKKPKRLAADL